MLNMFCMQFTALYRIVYERIFINLASVWTRKNAELAWAGCSAAHHMFRRRDGDAKQSFPEPPASLRHLQRHFVTLYALTSCRLRLPYSPIARGGTSLGSCYEQRRCPPARPQGRCDTMARWANVNRWMMHASLLWHSGWLPAPFVQSTNAPNAYIFYFLCADVVLINTLYNNSNTHARVHTVPLPFTSTILKRMTRGDKRHVSVACRRSSFHEAYLQNSLVWDTLEFESSSLLFLLSSLCRFQK